MNDTIYRQAAIDAVDSETVSTNPEHFKSSEKFIKFMDDTDIASFGKWQWANGFNTALVATTVQLKNLPSAERHEQITSEVDETFRIASEIRFAIGCNTSRECWELARKGDIQRVKHGRWIHRPIEEWGASNCKCSLCGTEYFFPLLLKGGADNYCGNCGAKMEK